MVSAVLKLKGSRDTRGGNLPSLGNLSETTVCNEIFQSNPKVWVAFQNSL